MPLPNDVIVTIRFYLNSGNVLTISDEKVNLSGKGDNYTKIKSLVNQGNDNQKWIHHIDSSGYSTFESVGHPGYFLDKHGGVSYNHMNLIIHSGKLSSAKKFSLYTSSNGKTLIKSNCSNAGFLSYDDSSIMFKNEVTENSHFFFQIHP